MKHVKPVNNKESKSSTLKNFQIKNNKLINKKNDYTVKEKGFVFIEAWINPISVRFVNEFAKQHPNLSVYYITDSDSVGKSNIVIGNDSVAGASLDTLSDKVHLVPLKNNKWPRRITFAPLWIGGALSSRLRTKYLQTLYLHSFPKLTLELEKIAPQVIQSNLLVMPYTWDAARYAHKNKIPFILRTEERTPNGLLQRIALKAILIKEKIVVQTATLVLPWTSQSQSFVRNEFNISESKIALLAASVDTNIFRQQKITNNSKTPIPKVTSKSAKKPIRCLTVQRFVTYKDYPTLLYGFRIAIDAGADYTLGILGFGPEEQSVRTLVKQLNLDSVVTFIPQRTYTDMPLLYKEFDVLLLSGRNEAIGMVVPESMACGVVPVVCDSAGATIYLTAETGLQFITGDPKSLARALQSLNHERIRIMGENAAKHIMQNYSVPNTVRKYTKLLSDAKVQF